MRSSDWSSDVCSSDLRKAKGFLAPWRCIDAVEAACSLSIAEGLKKEREFFFECMDSPQRKAQITAFFAEREAAKIRSEERRVGKEGVSTCRSRWSRSH